ncbi:MAG: type II toxin-antitoxin system HipA family toxin [Pseudomonadota bacterium]
MARKRTYPPLAVFMNTRRVATLAREAGGAVVFQYAPEWLAWENRMPVSLSLPLSDARYTGPSVHAVFDNLLPDNDAIRRRVAERVGAAGVDPYSLLTEIGRDCVGALQFLRADEASPTDHAPGVVPFDAEPVSDTEIARLLGELDMTPLGIRRQDDFRISVAGAQEKTALLRRDEQWFRPNGTTPTTHILKPTIGRLPNGMDLTHSVANEHFCLRLLAAFGLPVARTEIATFGETKALVVERFDRLWARDGRLLRLPQEDCCQALGVPSTQKYQNEGGPGIVAIMELLLGSDDAQMDREIFFLANVLFWLIGATDGHAKNFSLSLRPGGRFRLAPLYDVISVQPSVDARHVEPKDFRLAMRWGDKNHYRIRDIFPRHIEQTGVAAGLSREAIAGMLERLVRDADKAIETLLDDVGDAVPEEMVESIVGGLRRRLALLATKS